MIEQAPQGILRSSKLNPGGRGDSPATRSTKIGQQQLHEQDIEVGVRRLQIEQIAAGEKEYHWGMVSRKEQY